jgi:hypothetical protein
VQELQVQLQAVNATLEGTKQELAAANENQQELTEQLLDAHAEKVRLAAAGTKRLSHRILSRDLVTWIASGAQELRDAYSPVDIDGCLTACRCALCAGSEAGRQTLQSGWWPSH